MKVTRRTHYIARITGLMMIAVLLVGVPGLVSAQSSSGGVGGRVLNPDPDNPRSSSIFLYTLEKGQTKRDQLLVVNSTEEERVINLGSVDGVVTNTGAYTCRQNAEPVTGSGGWFKLSKTQVTVPAGGEEVVDFEVVVPENADVGEHNGCITIQEEQAEEEASGGGLVLRMRQAVRTVITIPGELHRELSIKNFEVNSSGAGQEYVFTTANTGNVSADVYKKVVLKNAFGNEVMTTGGEYPVMPDEDLTQYFRTQYRPLFGGWYEATPSIRYDTRLGVYGTQNAEAEYEEQVGAPVRFFLWPTMFGWLIIAVALGGIIGGTGSFFYRRKRQSALLSTLEDYVVREGDTVEKLALTAGVSWKDIAKINKLSAPYTLTPGSVVRVPTVYLKGEADGQISDSSTK